MVSLGQDEGKHPFLGQRVLPQRHLQRLVCPHPAFVCPRTILYFVRQ